MLRTNAWPLLDTADATKMSIKQTGRNHFPISHTNPGVPPIPSLLKLVVPPPREGSLQHPRQQVHLLPTEGYYRGTKRQKLEDILEDTTDRNGQCMDTGFIPIPYGNDMSSCYQAKYGHTHASSPNAFNIPSYAPGNAPKLSQTTLALTYPQITSKNLTQTVTATDAITIPMHVGNVREPSSGPPPKSVQTRRVQITTTPPDPMLIRIGTPLTSPIAITQPISDPLGSKNRISPQTIPNDILPQQTGSRLDGDLPTGRATSDRVRSSIAAPRVLYSWGNISHHLPCLSSLSNVQKRPDGTPYWNLTGAPYYGNFSNCTLDRPTVLITDLTGVPLSKEAENFDLPPASMIVLPDLCWKYLLRTLKVTLSRLTTVRKTDLANNTRMVILIMGSNECLLETQLITMRDSVTAIFQLWPNATLFLTIPSVNTKFLNDWCRARFTDYVQAVGELETIFSTGHEMPRLTIIPPLTPGLAHCIKVPRDDNNYPIYPITDIRILLDRASVRHLWRHVCHFVRPSLDENDHHLHPNVGCPSEDCLPEQLARLMLSRRKTTDRLADSMPATSVINFSSCFIPAPIFTMLRKGLKFIPKPLVQSRSKAVEQAADEFILRARRADYFYYRGENTPYHAWPSALRTPSVWEPASTYNTSLRDELYTLKQDMIRIANCRDRAAGQDPHITDKAATDLHQILIKEATRSEHLLSHLQSLPTTYDPNDLKATRPRPGRQNPTTSNYIPQVTDTNIRLRDLQRLAKGDRLIIKAADKGSSMIIMEGSSYVFEGHQQLADEDHYKVLGYTREVGLHPVSSGSWFTIRRHLSTLVEHEIVTEKVRDLIESRLNKSSQGRRIYFLPKIHKPFSDWRISKVQPKGRPIVSDSQSDTELVACLVEHLIFPLSITHDSYVKDTPHMIKILGETEAHHDDLLVTIDVASLYTNVDCAEALRTLRDLWRVADPDDPIRDAVLGLLRACIDGNDFQFDDLTILQLVGVAMGRHFSPSVANIFMSWFERTFLSTLPEHLKPKLYKRFLDDIFMLWDRGEANLLEFMSRIRHHHRRIKFTCEYDRDRVTFLDLGIFKGPSLLTRSRLDTEVHFKPTDTHELLHHSSFHTGHVAPGIVYSQFLRYHRNCSVSTAPLVFENILASTLVKQRAYPSNLIARARRKMLRASNRRAQCGFTPCRRRTCPICSVALCGEPLPPTIHSVASNTIAHKKVEIFHRTTCQTSNVVYVLTCTKCSARPQYVGQTTNCLEERLKQHYRAARRAPVQAQREGDAASQLPSVQTTHLYDHMRSCGGDKWLLAVPVIRVPNNYHVRATLLQRENDTIAVLGTHHSRGGLNMVGILKCPTVPLILKYTDISTEVQTLLKRFQRRAIHFSVPLHVAKIFIAHGKAGPSIKDSCTNARLCAKSPD